jgi:hypothetical protein
MTIEFLDDRDLGQYGKVTIGEVRDDLPEDYAMLQVKYGVATEVTAGAAPAAAQEGN